MQAVHTSIATGRELLPRGGDAEATIHVPTSATFYEAAIEGLTTLNEQMLRLANFPPIYESGVVYRKEARDTWRHADDVLCSGWGDCEDLAAWRAAELRVSGEDPDARVYVYRSGPHRFHAVVARGDGRIEDPSLKCGMPVSPERRAQMPKHEGDTEMPDETPRQFATCVGCGACSHGENCGSDSCGAVKKQKFNARAKKVLLGKDYKSKDQGQGRGASGIDGVEGGDLNEGAIGSWGGFLTSAIRHGRRFATPHRFITSRIPIANRLPFMAEGYEEASAGQEEEDQTDEDQQDDQEEEAPPPKPKKKKGGGGSKGPLLVRGIEKGANLVTKAVTLPLKGLSKITRFLLGVEGDPEYCVGDEDIFTSPETIEDVEKSPPSQRVRFHSAEVKPGVWQGQVIIPTTAPGKSITMKTSPAPSEAHAAERMLNLAKKAATTKNVLAVASPQALITMAALRSPVGKNLANQTKNAAQSVARRFLRR